MLAASTLVVAAMTGCSWLLDLDGLAGAGDTETPSVDLVPPRQNDARASIAPELDAGGPQTVLDESWIDAAPSSKWYGPLRDRGKPTPEGWCVDMTDASKEDGAIEYDTLLTGRRIFTRLEYRYDANPTLAVSDGATTVNIGILVIVPNRDWSASSRAIRGADAGQLVVDSEGVHGKAGIIPRSSFSVPLQIELEATTEGLRGRLYAREGADYLLRQAVDVVPSADLYDLSRGARARLAISTFFGAQRVCFTRVEVRVEP